MVASLKFLFKKVFPSSVEEWKTSKFFFVVKLRTLQNLTRCFSCSNVAEKINTKLANNVNAASSWTTNSFSTETLIIGISSCSQMGDQKCAKMICTGTAHLDSSGLRCCHESSIEERKPIISEDSIIFIVKVRQIYTFSEFLSVAVTHFAILNLSVEFGQELSCSQSWSITSKMSDFPFQWAGTTVCWIFLGRILFLNLTKLLI